MSNLSSLKEIDRSEFARVALFPLPNVVLLPGSVIPLHVFEPRYLDLTRDVIASSGLIALARLRAGYEMEYYGRPPVHTILGVGRIIDFRERSDGRYDILVRGLVRAFVAEELPLLRAYREVRAVVLEDQEPDEPAIVRATQQKLVSMCDQLSTLIEHGGSELRALVRSPSSPGACADTIASMLVADPDERQSLLETRDPVLRLERAIQYVSRILIELSPDRDQELLN